MKKNSRMPILIILLKKAKIEFFCLNFQKRDLKITESDLISVFHEILENPKTNGE